MITALVWLMGGIGIIAHLHGAGVRDRLIKTVFGILWPLVIILVMFSILADVIRAKGDTKLVRRAYDIREKELEGEADDDVS